MVERRAEMNAATESIEDINPEDLEEEQLLFQDCRKVIDAGIWLMRNGYSRMVILPYIADSSCWRCEFHPAGKPREPFFRYTSASKGKYLNDHGGQRVRRSITPKGLARAILRHSSPDVLKECEGDLSREMEVWFAQLERVMAARWMPAAFDNSGYAPSADKWNLVGMLGVPDSWIEAPPGYVSPSA